jgi:hypothetical protein
MFLAFIIKLKLIFYYTVYVNKLITTYKPGMLVKYQNIIDNP